MADPAESKSARSKLTTAAWAALVAGLSAYSLLTVWTNVLPTRRTLAATELRLQRLERQNESHERFLEAADRECEQLRYDPWTIERALRDELRMHRPGEQFVR